MDIHHIGTGARMSEAVIHGDTVYLAGQIALGSTVEDQARAVLSQIDTLLAQAGTSKAHLLRAVIWLADIADFGAMNIVWDDWIAGVRAPVRATGEVRLAGPEYRIEIIITAALPSAGDART